MEKEFFILKKEVDMKASSKMEISMDMVIFIIIVEICMPVNGKMISSMGMVFS